jgi:hypothetical protein
MLRVVSERAIQRLHHGVGLQTNGDRARHVFRLERIERAQND